LLFGEGRCRYAAWLQGWQGGSAFTLPSTDQRLLQREYNPSGDTTATPLVG
jgi:hypothetical protein